jgi:tetratricopeptide (TPR) repeat protein
MTDEFPDLDEYFKMRKEGIELYKEHNYAESILSFRKALEYFASSWDLWVRLSLACVKQAMIDKSDSLFTEAYASAKRGISCFYESRNLFDEDNIKFEGHDKQVYAAANYVLGICYLEYFGDQASAKKHYDLLMQIDPEFAKKLREIIYR